MRLSKPEKALCRHLARKMVQASNDRADKLTQDYPIETAAKVYATLKEVAETQRVITLP